MSRVCEDHLTLDLARLNLRPGATRRLPRVNVRYYEQEWQPYQFGGYVRRWVPSWVSAAMTRIGDTIRVAVSESDKDSTVRRSTHELQLVEASNVVGGTRLWFSCPGCKRYARILLYRRHRFQCRTCADLKHRSTVTFKTQRKEARLCEISRGMNGPGDCWTPLPTDRPRYMRKAREAALRAEHARLLSDLGLGGSDRTAHTPDPEAIAGVVRVAKSLGWVPPA